MDLEKKHAVYRENFKITFDLAGEHAKWLLSTLLLLNSGAIAGIFQKDSLHTNMALIVFALGVFFALASGILGWFNLQNAANYFAGAADDVLAGRTERHRPKSIVQTRQLAIKSAFASVGCLILGAGLSVWALW
jgi:hypothetical protein